MKKYLGVKLIEGAKEMSRKEYCDYRGWELPEDENGDERIYLVEYEAEENNKPNHLNHKGYISMSPKDVFEKAYKEIKYREDLPGCVVEAGTYQERVFEEMCELDNKVDKLTSFIQNPAGPFITLPSEEQTRLKQQLMAMQYYLTVLIERIENF